MQDYRLTREADNDLDEIWKYTNLKWGQNQARKYLEKLEEEFLTLVKNPYIGKKRYELSGSPLSFHCEKHIIFYRVINSTIEILRILHDSMDFQQHFN